MYFIVFASHVFWVCLLLQVWDYTFTISKQPTHSKSQTRFGKLIFRKKKIKFDYIPGEIQNRHECILLSTLSTRVVIIKWSSPLTLYFTQNFVAFSCSLTCCELLSIQIVKLLSCRYLKSLFEWLINFWNWLKNRI